MITVWKIQITDISESVALPRGAEPCFVAEQHGTTCVWVQLDDRKPREVLHEFIIVPTGGQVPEGAKYVGTALTQGGAFVWHVYDLIH